jgi:predicted acylesterase/phospholipase RssA
MTQSDTNEIFAHGFWRRNWPRVLDLALTVWVLRVQVTGIVIGLVIMWYAPQAQDLLVGLAIDDWTNIAVFFLLLFFVWALPTHYTARVLIDTDERYALRVAERNTTFIKRLQQHSPCVLGALTFVAILGAVVRSWWNLVDVELPDYTRGVKLQLLALGFGVAAALVGFWIYETQRDRIAETRATRLAEGLAAVPMAVVRRWLPALTEKGDRTSDGALGPLLLLLMFVIFVIPPFAFPLPFAKAFPRASAVPFILGGWVPLLAYLSALGRRWRAPFILIALTMTMVLPAIFRGGYYVRLIDPAHTVVEVTKNPNIKMPLEKLGLRDAIETWKEANNCEKPGDVCPRPIIVAASGGASRAGFFTAGVLGQLLDNQLLIDGEGHKLDPVQVRRRIFALSTVSGSSVGAVMTVAALAASPEPEGKQPCRVDTEELWHGDGRNKIKNWRSCLEALMAGDFATPVFDGFVFRDLFRFLGGLGWPDRGTLLEQSLERRFEYLIGNPTAGVNGLDCSGSLKCPFMTLRPRRADGKVHWLPLLVLNGTSVGTGQRIITTALDNEYKPGKDPCPHLSGEKCYIFPSSTRFHDLVNADRSKPKDIGLSTAAHNSARFPLISPPGAISDARGEVVDRIVDGGYFENFGAQTATELAVAMIAVASDLKPFILVLTNDPDLPIPRSRNGKKVNPDASIFSGEGSLMTDIMAPIKAFAHTRNARGMLAINDMRDILDKAMHGAGNRLCNDARIRVWGQLKVNSDAKVRDVSMSWWLSKPLQIFLHEQTEQTEQTSKITTPFICNRSRIKRLLVAMTRSDCAATEIDLTPECRQ